MRYISMLTLLVGLCIVTGCVSAQDQYIGIKYKGESFTTDSLGQYVTAPPGMTYLVVKLDIENHGYDSFSTNPNYFKVIIDNIQYDYSWQSYNLKDIGKQELPSVTMLDGGKESGYLAFEIPKQSTIYTLVYKAWSNYNIIYS